MGAPADALVLSEVETGQLDVERARELLRSTTDLDRIREIRDAAKLKAEYHRIRQHGIGAVNDAQRLVVRAQARLGEVLIKAKETGALRRGGDRKSKSRTDDNDLTLADLGVSRDESSRCQKLAHLERAGTLDLHMDTVAARGEKVTVKATINATSDAPGYDSDTWNTPEAYLEAAREVLGGIDIDPASNARAQQIVRAKWFHTARDSGLDHEWGGRVWLNPPYSRELVEAFTAKFVEELEAGRMTAGILLVNNATDTKWFQALARRFPFCLHEGRIAFLGPDGEPVRGTRQGQILFYAGDDVEAFGRVFERFGAIMVPRGRA